MECKQIETLWYPYNAYKGLQSKPILEDQDGLWIGKLIQNEVWAANERLAYLLHQALGLTGFRIPENKTIIFDDQPYLLTKYIYPHYKYRGVNSPFRELTKSQREVGLLSRIMANMDGNFDNLIQDRFDVVWSLDYEFSGEFEKYERELSSGDSQKLFNLIGYFMVGEKIDKSCFESAIAQIEEKIERQVFTHKTLRELCIQAQFHPQSIDRFENGIWNTLQNLRTRMDFLVDAWNTTYRRTNGREFRKPRTIPFYLTEGYECTITALQMALDACIPGLKTSKDQLKKLLGFKIGKGVYLVQIAQALGKMDFDYRYYAAKDRLMEVIGKDYQHIMREKYGDYSQPLIDLTDWDLVTEAIKNVLQTGRIIEKRPSLQMLREEIKKGNIVICFVDNSYLRNYTPRGKYLPHCAVITQITSDSVAYHATGPSNPEANRLIPIKNFELSWNFGWFDNDLLIIDVNG